MAAKATRQRFKPTIGQKVTLFAEKFAVQAHPSAPDMIYAAEGNRARVYRLVRQKDRRAFALKVFMRAYRDAGLVDGTLRLAGLQSLPGMEAASRRVILPDDPIVADFHDLEFAVLIPWISGQTWFDMLAGAEARKLAVDAGQAMWMSRKFLDVMSGLESRGLAHTDIAPGNVMLDRQRSAVELIDLEDMYFPNLQKPAVVNGGSPGYRHRAGQDLWRAEGDRYAGAVLAAELLILGNRDLSPLVTSEGFFRANATVDDARHRYVRAADWLRQVAPEFATLFAASWNSNRLEACPRLSQLRDAVPARVPEVTRSQVARSEVPEIDGVKWEPWATGPGAQQPPPPPPKTDNYALLLIPPVAFGILLCLVSGHPTPAIVLMLMLFGIIFKAMTKKT